MITVALLGDQALEAKFTRLGPDAHLRIVKAMRTVMLRLQAFVKSGKLTGQALHVRTGALRRSIGERVEDTGAEVAGKVGIFSGPTLPYGRAHEFGFSGTVTVSEHLRQVKQAFGRPITPVTATVRSHTRRMHLPERSFLRSALQEFGPAVEQALAVALREAVEAA